MDGVILNTSKKIEHSQGNIYHAMKCTDPNFSGFGEAYFSFIHYGDIKGWKKHTEMQMNILVPIGEIEFVIYDDRDKSKTKNEFYSIKLSQDNYHRLSVSPGLWVAFRGCHSGSNMLLNIASIAHNPLESVNINIKDIAYEW
jgi:dTDP-4-dehydrorhamnose 3,5-epimerase